MAHTPIRSSRTTRAARSVALGALVALVASSCLTVGSPVSLAAGTRINDVNAGGVMVGAHWVATPTDRAYRWDSASQQGTDLGTLGGSTSSAAAINDAGMIVGSSTTAAGATRAFTWDPATAEMHDLGTFGGNGSGALDINAAGTVVGWSQVASGHAHAFSYDPATETMTDLGTLGGATSVAHAINDRGVIVGQADLAGGASQAFALDPDAATMVGLGTLGGASSSAADLDEQGTIVGWSELAVPDPCVARYGDVHPPCPTTRAFAYDVASGVMSDLGTVAGTTHSAATGINEHGIVSGYANPLPELCTRCSPRARAVAFELGTTGRYDLGGPGWLASAVNDEGLVVGTATEVLGPTEVKPRGFAVPVDRTG